MEYLNTVRRAKTKTGIDMHDTKHAADDHMTYCGKDIDDGMWFVVSVEKEPFEIITCKSCRAALIKERNE